MNLGFASARREGDDRGVRKVGRPLAKTAVESATLSMGTVGGLKETTHFIKVVNGSASRKIHYKSSKLMFSSLV